MRPEIEARTVYRRAGRFAKQPDFGFPRGKKPPKVRFIMQTSARNCFSGKVVGIKKGPILAELEIAVGQQTSLVSHISFSTFSEMGLSVGSPVQALVKASQVVLFTETPGLRLSTRNRFCGSISALHPGAVNTEVIVRIESDLSVVAIVTNESATDLRLQVGNRICAAFPPSSVLLAADA